VIDRYLAELSRHLHVGPLRRRRILAEVRTHLEDAGQGGVERFGDPADVAARFNAVHPPPPARLTAVAVIVTSWLIFAAVQGSESRMHPAPWPDGQAPGRIDELLSYATFSLLAAVAVGLATLVAPRPFRLGLSLASAALIVTCAAMLVGHTAARGQYVEGQPSAWWAAGIALAVLAPTLGATAFTTRAAFRRGS
jgi:hypothetical protein